MCTIDRDILPEQVILTGKYVKLRPIKVEDAEITLKWRSSQRASLLNKGSNTVQEQRDWITKQSKSNINMIIEYKDEPVGMLALVDINNDYKLAEYGRLLIGEIDKVGTAPVFFESSLLILDYAFSKLNLHKIYGYMSVTNKQILNLWLNMGFVREGTMRDHIVLDGKFVDCAFISLLENEFYETLQPKMQKLVDLYR